jgi:hypothetical protein
MRKAGIHLTMSQQVEGTGFGSEAKASLFRNTAIKLMGGTLSSEMAGLMNIPKGVPPLERRQFWGLWGAPEPFRLTVRDDLADHHQKTPHGAWEAVLGRQLSTYYREPPPRLAPPAPEQNAPARPNNRFELE